MGLTPKLDAAALLPLLPARMLNEYAFCPRLFHLEWVQGEFADNHHTVDGQTVHRRVNKDQGDGLPEPSDASPFESRSVELSSETLGLSAKIDLIEGEGGVVQPVDYKRGAVPRVPEGAWEPERVQLCAYGLLLREHGYRCDSGVLYFAKSRRRVEIEFSAALIARTLELIREARALVARTELPPPLVGSPKCAGCSLNAICLPDEVNLLAAEAETQRRERPRQLVAPRDDASPLYVVGQGLRVGLDHQVLEVRDRDAGVVSTARLADTSQLVVMGNNQVSTQALREACDRGISTCWMSYGGWFFALAEGTSHKNVLLRLAQFRAADDPARALALAQRFVRTKVANARTLLRRNGDPSAQVLGALSEMMERAGDAAELGELLGIEGNAARIYFGAFQQMLRPPSAQRSEFAFDFEGRNRRPPKDPVNALLSLAYSMLTKDLTVTARAVGFDPFLGFYHQPRYGRPALALDLMEEFRPLIADSVVVTAINTGVVGTDDFERHAQGVALTPEGRKRLFRAYERRMEEEITHPIFGYKISYRRVLDVQCRLLARHLLGEIPEYPEFRTR